MQGLPLSSTEIVALLRREIATLTDLGVRHERAIAEVARRYGADIAKVRQLLAPCASTGADSATPLAA